MGGWVQYKVCVRAHVLRGECVCEGGDLEGGVSGLTPLPRGFTPVWRWGGGKEQEEWGAM